MAEKLFDAKRLDKYAKNGYESCAFSQREEQDAFSFWWPLVKDCGIRVPETVIIKVPKELDEEGQKTFYRHFYMERPGNSDSGDREHLPVLPVRVEPFP